MSAPYSLTYPPELEKYAKNLEDLLKDYPMVNSVCCGGLIFNRPEGGSSSSDNSNGDEPLKLLCVKRAKADAFPEFWEVPGGAMESTDETLLHAVAREVVEETGLTVTRFVRYVNSDHFYGRKRLRHWRKFNFVVEVDGFESLKLDPREHSEYRWLTSEEITDGIFEGEDTYPIGRSFFAVKNAMLLGFKLWGKKEDEAGSSINGRL